MHKYALTLRQADKYDLKAIREHRVNNRQYYHKTSVLDEDVFTRWLDSLDLNVSSPHALVLVGIDHNDVEQPICSWQMVGAGYVRLTNICHKHKTASISYDVYEQSRYKTIGNKLLSSGIEYCRHILDLMKLRCEVLESNTVSKSILEQNGFSREKSHHNHACYLKSLR